jgi:hypothetical protein
MGNKFASGAKALAICDRCGQTFKLPQLRSTIVNARQTNIKVCRSCWEPDHQQLRLGSFPVEDPQALRDPRPDTNKPSFRDYQYGWNPVGGGADFTGAVNNLVVQGLVGQVTVEV